MLVAFAGSEHLAHVQGPVRLDEHNEPQPDLALLGFREDFYEREHPGPGDTLLLVEVSDSSLEYDRSVKLPLYAGAGIPEVWIVDLAAGEIESHSGPRPGSPTGGYGTRKLYSRGEEMVSQTISELKLSVGEVLGG